MSEVEEIGQAAGRAGSAVLSAALGVARELMRQRAEKAEQARREGERRQIEVARQLHVDRETAAVGWQRVNLRAWFRESPQEVARTWASAATWAPHDPRAREAFESLNLHLDRLGVHQPEVAQVMREAGNYDGLAGLLKQGAQDAYGRISGQTPTGASTQTPDQDVAGWQRITLAQQFQDSPQDVAQVWASAATWAPYDPAARETFESLNPQLGRLGIEVPEVGEALTGASGPSELGTLLEQGGEFQSAMDAAADWNAFLDTYDGRPYEEMWSALDNYLQQWAAAEPAYGEALRQAATNAGSQDLAAWYLSHPSEAYEVFRAHVEQPATTTAQNNAPAAEAVAPMPRSEPGRPVSVSQVGPTDLAELVSTYEREPATAKAAMTREVQRLAAESPVFARDLHAVAGTRNLPAWSARNPDLALRAVSDHHERCSREVPGYEVPAYVVALKQAREYLLGHSQPARQVSERRPEAQPRAAATQTYQKGSAAAQLGGQGFAKAGADAVRTGAGKHRRTSATTHRQSKQSRNREEQGRG